MSSEEDLVQWDCTNLEKPYTVVQEIVLCYWTTTNTIDRDRDRELVQSVWTILATDQRRDIFLYLVRYGAATAYELQHELNIPKQTVYDTLHRFDGLGLCCEGAQVDSNVRGPKPSVWGLSWAPRETYHKATSRYLELKKERKKNRKKMEVELWQPEVEAFADKILSREYLVRHSRVVTRSRGRGRDTFNFKAIQPEPFNSWVRDLRIDFSKARRLFCLEIRDRGYMLSF